MEILFKTAPHWATSMETVVDTVVHLGRREEGKHRQIIIQFTMRHHWDALVAFSYQARFLYSCPAKDGAGSGCREERVLQRPCGVH